MNLIMLSLHLLGALGVFLYGLKVMSEGLQKAAGSRLRDILSKATSNRFGATLSGFIVTCAVQSSSATTVMVVGFSAAGLLTLYQSLGVIFGANIGTTTTAWIVSLLGFKIKITTFALPLIGIGFFSQFIRRWRWPHKVGEVLVGFGLLFLGLHLLKTGIPNVKEAPEVMAWISRFSGGSVGPRMLAVLVGAVLTMIFQSSSAMMAVTLTAAAKGLIDYPTAAALVLGENIGTTITANIAAIGAPLSSKRAALGHFLFNIFGVIWAVLLFLPFLHFVDKIVPGDPWGTGEHSLLVGIPTHLSAFHTVFNLINTGIMLTVIRRIERVILTVLPEPAAEPKKDDHGLVFLSTPLASTPELVIPAAQQEVDRMAGVVLLMIQKIRSILKPGVVDLPTMLDSILKDERTTDVLEHRINEYLTNVTHLHLSTDTNKEAISLLSMINDLERMGDHGEKIATILKRRHDGTHVFSREAAEDLLQMADKTENIVGHARQLILHRKEDPIPEAYEREQELNKLRDKFRRSHIERMAKKKVAPTAGIDFNDLLTSFEKMGDHAFNVVEATAGIK